MIGSLLIRSLVLVLGYAYPAYECYKTVELNRPEVEQLRFWCQYWILIALLTVFERIGDAFVSWLPMYGEAKLAFIVYLWYSKTKGTTYVYENFFRPYIAKHEPEIDRNLLELKTRAGDIIVLFWRRAASYSQARFFEIMQYVALQSRAQPSSVPPVQQPQQARVVPSLLQLQAQQSPVAPPPSPVHQSAASQQPPDIPTESQQHGVPEPVSSPAKHRLAATSKPATPGRRLSTSTSDAGLQADSSSTASSQDPTPEETSMEEAVRMTRARLRKKAGAAAGNRSHL